MELLELRPVTGVQRMSLVSGILVYPLVLEGLQGLLPDKGGSMRSIEPVVVRLVNPCRAGRYRQRLLRSPPFWAFGSVRSCRGFSGTRPKTLIWGRHCIGFLFPKR